MDFLAQPNTKILLFFNAKISSEGMLIYFLHQLGIEAH